MNIKPILSRLELVLEPHGFVRREATWNRKIANFVNVLDIQTSKSGDLVTVNAGVLDRDVFRDSWGHNAPAFVDEPACTIRVRIGQLIDDKDKWWRILDAQASEDIAEHVVNYVLPFFEQMYSREAMVEWLTKEKVVDRKYPLPVIYFAVLKHHLGQEQDAQVLLKKLREKSVSGWRTRIDEVLKRLSWRSD